MAEYGGDMLQSVITGHQDINVKEQILIEFKNHVKRDYVDLEYVPSNFEALTYATAKYQHYELGNIAFSTVCHLVKRVSFQDHTLLKSCAAKVVPCLIQHLKSENKAVHGAAKKALGVYWECCPNEVDSMLKQVGLQAADDALKIATLQFLIKLIDVHKASFLFKMYTSTVVSFLRESRSAQMKDCATVLLVKFFRNASNRNAKLDLVSELTKQNIDRSTVHALLVDIDADLITDYNQLSFPVVQSRHDDDMDSSEKFVTSGSVKITASGAPVTHPSKPNSYQTLRAKSSQPKLKSSVMDAGYDQIMSDTSLHSTITNTTTTTTTNNRKPQHSAELASYLAKIPGYQLENVKGTNVPNANKLRQDFEDMLPSFADKETEFNWNTREKNIIFVRSILRGNAPVEFAEVLSQCLRGFCDAIAKAASSLRTSLSSNGCSLVKEMSTIMGSHLDNVTIDVCASTLLKLSGATKKIASQNAMVALSSLIANISHYHRVFNQVINAAHDKNVQPRLYSSTWIHIYILKNHDVLDSTASISALDAMDKAIVKCLSDPNPSVRESMRTTFWCFYRYWPNIGDNSLAKLDLPTKKALERARPTAITSAEKVKTPKKRQSIRELIVSKNRASNVAPPPQPTFTSRSHSGKSGSSNMKDLGKPVRLGLPQNTKRSSSSRSVSSNSLRSRSEDIRQQRSNDESVKDIFSRAPSKDLESSSSVKEKSMTPMSESNQHEQRESASPAQIIASPEEPQNDIQEGYIVSLMKSDDPEMIAEAISMLRFALLAREEVDPAVKEILQSLAIKEPSLLKPLFGADVISESSRLFSTSDFLRSLAISFSSDGTTVNTAADAELVSRLVETIPPLDMYPACIELIRISSNISLVSENTLAIQFIRYKRQILAYAIHLMDRALDSFPINDSSYLELVDALIQAVDYFQTLDSDYETEVHSYIGLLRKLFEMNRLLFGKALKEHDSTVSSNLLSFTSIDLQAVDISDDDGDKDAGVGDIDSDYAMTEDSQVAGAFEMTMIQPNSSVLHAQKVDIEAVAANDMTMIMPNFGKPKVVIARHIEDHSIHEEDENDDSIFQHQGLNFEKAAKEVNRSFSEDEAAAGPSEDQKENESDRQSPSSSDLISSIKKVNISSPPVPVSADIEHIINKSDPFASFSADKNVQIYHDEAGNGISSTDGLLYPKPRETETTRDEAWFTFQLQKYSSVHLRSPIESTVVDQLQKRCFSEGASQDEWMMLQIIALQVSRPLLSTDLLVEFLSTKQAEDELIGGLTLLVNDLVLRSFISKQDLENIWNLVLFRFPVNCEYHGNEVWFAVSDLIHELVVKDRDLVFTAIIGTLLNDKKQVLVALEGVKILVGSKCDELSVAQVEALSKFCVKYANDSNVEIRKSVISVLCHLTSKINGSDVEGSNKGVIVDETTQFLTSAQQKLIEEFI